MKIKYKNIVRAFVGLFIVGGVWFAPMVSVSALECGVLPSDICNGIEGEKRTTSTNVKDSAVGKLLLAGVNIMTAGVAILAVGGIIYGAVMYTSAGPNQSQVAKAREILMNVVIGIVAFALMWALLQWLIPGGVFN